MKKEKYQNKVDFLFDNSNLEAIQMQINLT